jgi:DNA polymerase V
MSGPVFALVDCNNFYASCEKLFRPAIARRPLVVLSNNDGCVVARSAEAKALGIKMGVPVFMIKAEIKRHQIEVCSSNYSLYADMSARVMQVLEQMAPEVEVYSIDEAFLGLGTLAAQYNLQTYALEIRNRVEKWTGIRTCVGIGPSKTLAKLANYAAKKYPATGGVLDLRDSQRRERLMKITPVEEVWGVGRQLTKSLNSYGIKTVWDLHQVDLKSARAKYSVVLERTISELRGISCLALEDAAPPKKQIVCSRSFGSRITDIAQLREAVRTYAGRATEKLRGEGQSAGHLSVFIRTGGFNQSEPNYSNSAVTRLNPPTSDTRIISRHAIRLLESIWREGYRYAKAGVILQDFTAGGVKQNDLFAETSTEENSAAVMKLMDAINAKVGKVWLAGQGVNHVWQMSRERLSPRYTTAWDDLPIAR